MLFCFCRKMTKLRDPLPEVNSMYLPTKGCNSDPVGNGVIEKSNLEIAVTGHRFISDEPKRLKETVREILKRYGKMYRVTVCSCLAYGADLLVAECAAELGFPLKAVLPMPTEVYIESIRQDLLAHGKRFTKEDEALMRHLLAQTVSCTVVEDPQLPYNGASKYLVDECDKLIALWDGKTLPLEDEQGRPINRGGTYDCITRAEAQKKEVIVVKCRREK